MLTAGGSQKETGSLGMGLAMEGVSAAQVDEGPRLPTFCGWLGNAG